jgi:hypothetical protein
MNWTRFLIGALAYLLSFIMGSLLVIWCWSWLTAYDDHKAVDILASREADLGVSVYAQFSLSQLFEVQPEAEITKLVLPLYMPDPSKSLLVTLTKEKENIATWRLKNDPKKIKASGIYDIELKLKNPTVLSGNYHINLSGQDITHEDKEKAPRVFVEKDDSKYEPGNYWIADNKKTGDISLQVIERRARWAQFRNDWQQDPLQGAITISSYLLLFLTVLVGPHVLLRRLVRQPSD